MASIDIFNPRNKTYDGLSNNFKSFTVINGETWKTISNYIYTKALPSVVDYSKMKRVNPDDIHYDYEKFKNLEEEDILSVALLEALKVKFQNKKMMDILLTTGYAPIIYESDNNFLGTGRDNTGKNKLGNFMVQIRNEVLNKLKREKEIFDREEKIYKAYLVKTALEYAFNDEENDLKEYFGLTFDEIIDKYGRQKILTIAPPKKNILELYEFGYDAKIINLSIAYPDALIFNIRKKLETYAINKEVNLKNKIFNIFIDNLIRKNFPDLDPSLYVVAKEQMISKMTSYEDLQKIKDSIYNTAKDFKNPIQGQVRELIINANIPSEQEILLAKNFNIDDIKFFQTVEEEKKHSIESTSNQFPVPQPGSPTYRPPGSPTAYDPETTFYIPPGSPTYRPPGSPTYRPLGSPTYRPPGSPTAYDPETTYYMPTTGSPTYATYDPESTSYIPQVSPKYDPDREAMEPLRYPISKSDSPTYIFENLPYPDSPIYDPKAMENLNLNLKNKKFMEDIGDGSSSDSESDSDDDKEIILKQKEIVKKDQLPIKPLNILRPYIIKPGNPSTTSYVIEDTINPLQLLSPIYFTGMLNIKGLSYPTVTHYLYAVLFSLVYGIDTIEKGYNYILNYSKETYNNLFGHLKYPPTKFLSYKYLSEYLDYITDTNDVEKFEKLAKESLDAKFKNIKYQNILLATENKIIVWNDKKDGILGTGKLISYNVNPEAYTSVEELIFAIRRKSMIVDGKNYVGKYLMDLRKSIINNRLNSTLVTDKDFNKLYKESALIHDWVNLKVDDMCKTLIKFKEYYEDKYSIRMTFDNKNVITTIIPNIYIQCKDIYKQSNNVNTDNIPLEFKNYVKKYKNNLQGYSNLFWAFIFSIIKFLINNISTPTTFNIEQILYKSELVISRNNKCLEILPNKNNKLNCIISAIINLLKSISIIDDEKDKFINTRDIDYIIKKNDVELAVSIILNTRKIVNIEYFSFEDKLEDIDIQYSTKIETQYFDDDLESIGKKIEVPGGEEDEVEIYQDVEDEEDSEGEKEYDYDEDDNEDDNEDEDDNEGEERDYDSGEDDGAGDKTVTFSEDVYSPKNKYATKYENKLIQTPKRSKRYNKIYNKELSQYLKTNNTFGLINYAEVTELILSGANFVINYKQMPEKVKNNRINFFGTLV